MFVPQIRMLQGKKHRGIPRNCYAAPSAWRAGCNLMISTAAPIPLTPREAAAHFVMVEEIQPEKLDAYWNASLAFLESGQYDMAYEQVVKYLERETDPQLRADARSLVEEISGKLADRKRYQKEGTR